jgi:DNA-binding protein YbaB
MGLVVADQVDLGVAEFERLLAETRRALAQTRAGAASEPDAAGVRGTGVAAEGQVRVTARASGRVESVELEPRALRLGTQLLGEQIALAVNAALDDLQVQAAAQAGPAADPAGLAERMQELQDQSVRQMQLFSQGIATAISQITAAAGPRPAAGAPPAAAPRPGTEGGRT